MLDHAIAHAGTKGREWRRFVALFLGVFVGGIFGAALFILLLDPFDIVPFSLPRGRPLVSGTMT